MNLRGDITPAFSNTGTGPGEKSALQRALEGILFNSASGIVESTADDAGMVASLASVLADPIRSGEAAGRSVRQALPAISQGVSNFVSQPPSEMLSSAGALGNAALKAIQQGVEERGIGGVASATDFVPAGMLAGALPLLADLGKVAKMGKNVSRALPDVLAEVSIAGKKFKTGSPVEFDFIRNPEKAPDMGSTFGQDIEPAGRFISRKEAGFVPTGWEEGKASFNNPLVIEHIDTREWKRKLSERYGGKTGAELSDAIRADGFDGIITVDSKAGETSEIVDLGAIGAASNKAATPRQNIDAFREQVLAKYDGLKDFDVFESGDDIKLNMLAVDKSAQKQGIGSAAMTDLVNYADDVGKRIRLTTGTKDPNFGTTSMARLKKFYKRFGFVENKGRNKDFSISDNMFRYPQGMGDMARVDVQAADNLTPTQRRLRELAEGVENPGALERARLEGQGAKPVDDATREFLEIGASDLSGITDPAQRQMMEREMARLRREAGPLAALDNLDPIEKARLDRAVQQGFDLDAYHGTKGDIQSFDPGLLGATTGAPSARVGFFFAAEPETAATYARTADLRALNPKGQSIKEQLAALDINDPDYDAKRAQLIEAKKTDRLQGIEKAGKSYDDNIRELEERKRAVAGNVVVDPKSNTLALPAEYQVEYDRLNNELARVRSEREKLEDMGQNILPVKLRLQNPLVHDFGGGSYREVSYRELLDQAQRDGKDGAIFRNTQDGGPVTDIYVVFEPSQIRSRFAAFDPKDAPRVCYRQRLHGRNLPRCNALLKISKATGGFSGPDEFQELLQLERDYSAAIIPNESESKDARNRRHYCDHAAGLIPARCRDSRCSV
jgi:GNAT superfamily N-acetyltransferase